MSTFVVANVREALETERAEPKPGDKVFYDGKMYKVHEGKRQRLENYGSCWFSGKFCAFRDATYICKIFRCYGTERLDKKDIYFIEV